MIDNDNKRTVKLTDVGQQESPESEGSSKDNLQKLKKPLIFVLMAVVFLGCMYLIFAPSSDADEKQQTGLNEAVPQATEAGMQADKGKAYETDLLDQKELEKKQSLSALSAYWNSDSSSSQSGIASTGNPVSNGGGYASSQHEALNSYRNIQGTLGSFYQDNGRSSELQNEVRSLKAQLAEREAPPANPVQNQLALMEKSYQLAAKYFPTSGNSAKTVERTPKNVPDTAKQVVPKVSFAALYPVQQNVVSALYREPSDSAFLSELRQVKNRNFYTAGKVAEAKQAVNSIRACIHETQTITVDQTVRIRLLESIRLSKLAIPKGAVVTAIAKFQGLRLQLLVGSIEFNGHIIPVELTAFDLDGQSGLAIPYSTERSALTEMAANMGNTGGTSISLSSSTGQQITSDLSKSVVQGISGYFAKRVRTPKITLKAGHKIFLVAKK
ncbi:conjugative transposon protein TraM [Chryseobacterium sp. MEBOG07]|uniref:conjugative transposon protein TraM n=1 Tax=Chryseobacterium sp. MEBOG07 TaxID=2879939 RepID=UPI001F18FBEA|nr:conjugative transposon protein TraM [Chryseobacterium sp. MEBOG07]UKB78600.1 conjugative transposon protein TraM [Chryseobacterium sp. MEBOG07]